MIVRSAALQDLSTIGEIGRSAMRDTYQGLLKAITVEQWLETAYSMPALLRRWEDHPIFVAEDGSELIGFADAFLQDDHIVLSAIYTRPAARGRGAGTRLLDRVRGLDPSAPVSCDVILGNVKGESFYEARGFVPGEIVHTALFGEPVIERRWWLPAKTPPRRLAARSR